MRTGRYVESHFDEMVIRPAMPLARPVPRRCRAAGPAAARAPSASRSPAPFRLRGAASRRAFDGPRVRQRPHRGLAGRLAGLCRRRARRDLPSHARRLGADAAARPCPRPHWAAWRRAGRTASRIARQGRVDSLRRAGCGGDAFASAGRGRRASPQRQRSAQPRGRQSLLAWPARRASGRSCAAPSHGRASHDERVGAVQPAGTQDPRADACRRARPAEELPSEPEELCNRWRPRFWRRSCTSRGAARWTRRCAALYRTAALVRDRISADTWRIVNQLDLDLLAPGLARQRSTATEVRLGETLTTLNQVFNLLSSLSGLMTESMTRGPGWRFVDMGRRLERALTVLRLLAQNAGLRRPTNRCRCWRPFWKSPTAR